ncbi:glycosyltransferase [Plebeiibacterium marinum]|uniref:Glycosyl transferase family 28 C-terminal domain-containing protein n=1 Tax=Plebeiibacterium marinum TaxID=2992111 RepID=A0AAE3SKU3_9BACT|nr:glycosyltransferase [Plebeiobacterium marinum]MCW3806888.1 hypothetical protein [Plebeiobacterium marinum]
MNDQLTYLVCPLNWGLGHASRMVPLINTFLNQGHKVIIAADGNALTYTAKEFPNLTHIRLKDVNIKFSSNKNSFKLIKLIPAIIINAVGEHFRLKKILGSHHIDIIVSDNRYGLWNKKTKSVFITHQLMIKLPGKFSLFEYAIHKIINSIVNKYDECWIPDYPDPDNNLSGDLSHKYPQPQNSTFIFPLTRFSEIKKLIDTPKFDIVAILSGPEPARSEFESTLISALKKSTQKTLIIQGKMDFQSKEQFKNITIVPGTTSQQIKSYLVNARLIICRPGYSTIMDLDAINRQALLIPTPGQTEQEYLSQHHSTKHFRLNQDQISLSKIEQVIAKSNL